MNAVFESERNMYVLNMEYAVNRVNIVADCKEHTHDYVEIVYTFGGRALHRVDGREYTLQRGDLLLINYGSLHSLYPKPQSEYVDIMLKPEFLDDSLAGEQSAFSLLRLKQFCDYSCASQNGVNLIHFSRDQRRLIEPLIEMTLEEQEEVRAGAELMRRSALNILLSLIFRRMAEPTGTRMEVGEKLLLYIKANCHEKLTAEAMAQRCFYSEEHFSRSFKKYTGKTFTAYLADCRLELAMRLLRETNKSIETVFEECGFSNRTNFFRMFSQKTGLTPAQYRKISK